MIRCFVFLILCYPFSGICETFPEEKKRLLETEIKSIMQGKWIPVTEEKDSVGEFKATRQFDEKNGLFTMRLEATVNFPIIDVASIWFDNIALKKEWMDLCEDMTLIQRSSDQVDNDKRSYSKIYQIITEPVLFVKGRTFISREFTTIDKQTKSIQNIGSAVDQPFKNFSEAYQSNKLVLGKVIVSKSYMEQNKADPNKTNIDFLVLVDPAGPVPNWIVNIVSSGWPEKIYYGMIEQIKKNQHKKIDFFREPQSNDVINRSFHQKMSFRL